MELDSPAADALAKAYLNRVSELAGARISLVGIGPSRDQTLVA
jgi:adenylosuccinate synthase